MDFTAILPRSFHPALAWAGRTDWLAVEPGPDFRTGFRFDSDALRGLPGAGRHLPVLARLLSIPDAPVGLLPLSKCLGFGPKLFRPTREQCEALARTRVSVGFEDYRQPYPAVVIEFPEDYRRAVAGRLGRAGCPRLLVAYHDEGRSGAVIVLAIWHPPPGGEPITNVMVPRPEYRDMEDALARRVIGPGDDPGDFAAAELAERLALNFCLMMTHLGVRVVGPLRPDEARRHRKLARSRYTEERERGELLSVGDFTLLDFDQHVRLHDTIEPRAGDGVPTGVRRKPHWRRGHWRMQPCGTGRAEKRLSFVRPVFVNLRLFGGDLGNTAVSYEW